MITCQKNTIFVDGVETSKGRITFEILLQDAIDRKSIEAWKFIDEKNKETTTNTNKHGKEITRAKGAPSYRDEYLRKYCGYVPASKTNSNYAKMKKQRLLADALKLIQGE